MSEPQARKWEVLSFVDYPMIRNVQNIAIYQVTGSHVIQNWLASMRRKVPRHTLESTGMKTHFEDPGWQDEFTIKPLFIVHIMGDLLSVTERGMLSILYPKGSTPEVVHVAEPAARAMTFDTELGSWSQNNYIKSLDADFDFLTAAMEQKLLDLASRWIVARRAAWKVSSGDEVCLDTFGDDLRELCEKSLETTLACEMEEMGMADSSPSANGELSSDD